MPRERMDAHSTRRGHLIVPGMKSVAGFEMPAPHAAVITSRTDRPMRQQPSLASHQRLLGAALSWMIAGIALLLTVVPMHTRMLGWAPAFWLVGAPLIVLLVLEPSLPRQLLALRRQRHDASRHLVWH
jgi:hypothetical protein